MYHKSRAQQQAVQRLGHISSVNVVVVGVVVFAVSSLQRGEEFCQAWDGYLQKALHNQADIKYQSFTKFASAVKTEASRCYINFSIRHLTLATHYWSPSNTTMWKEIPYAWLYLQITAHIWHKNTAVIIILQWDVLSKGGAILAGQ